MKLVYEVDRDDDFEPNISLQSFTQKEAKGLTVRASLNTRIMQTSFEACAGVKLFFSTHYCSINPTGEQFKPTNIFTVKRPHVYIQFYLWQQTINECFQASIYSLLPHFE